ncbi:hypothetical protein EDD28_3063 [Salana multivorans]|uniref:Uncharacterized protein n=1 Tax=Salana multivorans TaxID=120377 RepID=A0A3N2D1L9_9MICO|nr:hypothetical protein [Salana multivorans]MBN8882048.1 hypothetical protein [Salana multivorans]OJX94427.1 MAG: hypothetical protein BGO96_16255 [Micrococcales bacterium 73-15]ROR93641.1 hypothetical protein EDD28_3063 [Salana multivorans]
MPNTVVVITEDALLPIDVTHIRTIAGPDGTDVRLIVPSEVRRSVVADFIDHLAVLDLKEAWEDLTGANDVTPDEAIATASDALARSVAALAEQGLDVASGTVADDVVAALRTELETAQGEIQVFAVTQPRAVADAFHRGWADRIEEELDVAVLHFYTGTSYLEA